MTTVREGFYWVASIGLILIIAISFFWLPMYHALWIWLPLIAVGIYDILQKKRNVLRIYPILGHIRYLMESVRPQIQQYYIERNTEEVPFSREQWEIIKERATQTQDNIPFGTQLNVKALGYEWINHSLAPKKIITHELKVRVGGPDCLKPYTASRLNISAMSFGALSSHAIRALNRGAKLGGFAQNTGEGGLSPYHLIEGGDLIWQIGTAYFGCRTPEGGFDAEQFQEKSNLDVIKMIEIKLSQGAKPAHGGILPAAKVTHEIAASRGIPMGEDCISPAAHSEFSTPIGLLEFVKKLRDLAGGKPVGFKLCLGIHREFVAICKAMLKTNIYPDFITVDGSEGGTGAAPPEFTDFMGTPLNDALVFINNCLLGTGVRHHIKLIASGKIVTGFDVISKIALGANMCNAARPMMFAIGCIQSRRCHTNQCPTGVATQNPKRTFALDVNLRAKHVRNFHDATLQHFREVLGAAGIDHPDHVFRSRIRRRIRTDQNARYSDIYPELAPNAFIENNNLPYPYDYYWQNSGAHTFEKCTPDKDE